MKDNLKEFMDRHNDDFNSETPPDIWNQVADQLSSKEERKVKRLWVKHLVRVAAAAILLFGLGVLVGRFYIADQQHYAVETQIELKDMTTFYTKQVNERMHLLDGAPKDKKLIKDLEELETTFLKLKAELAENANDKQILEAMRQSYQAKLEILDIVISRKVNKSPKIKHL